MFDGITTEQEPEPLSSFLERAMHLIDEEGNWCQKAYHRISGSVEQYCALGALDHAEGSNSIVVDHAQRNLKLAAAHLGLVADVAAVNDVLGHKVVMLMYRTAIAEAKAREAFGG